MAVGRDTGFAPPSSPTSTAEAAFHLAGGHHVSGLSENEQKFIEEAAAYLENPRFLMRVANLVGKPAEALLQRLPQSAKEGLTEATRSALETSMRWSLRTLPNPRLPSASLMLVPGEQASATRRLERHMHTAVAATTGAVGGFFGLAGMTVEVPATTLVMLRSIARIAAEEGFPIDDPQIQLHCLAVLSFGGEKLQAMDSAYLSSRLGLALVIRDAATFIAKHSTREIGQALSRGTAPVLVRLINRVATRFQVVLSHKFAAQGVPVAGAAMGALINAAFTDHFNRVARYHFGILRLEEKYGRELIQSTYQRAIDCRPTRMSNSS